MVLNYHSNLYRELRHEKTWARINMIPLLEAELDRDLVRRESIVTQREAEVMKSKKDWIPMDLKAPISGIGKNGERNEHSAEPVYHTKRYVRPSLIFLPPSQDRNILDPQWWRGSKVLTKVNYSSINIFNFQESPLSRSIRFQQAIPDWTIVDTFD